MGLSFFNQRRAREAEKAKLLAIKVTPAPVIEEIKPVDEEIKPVEEEIEPVEVEEIQPVEEAQPVDEEIKPVEEEVQKEASKRKKTDAEKLKRKNKDK